MREGAYNLDAGRRQQSADCGQADVGFAPGHEVTEDRSAYLPADTWRTVQRVVGGNIRC